MAEVWNFIEKANIQTIGSTFIMLLYFTRHIESKMEKQTARTDRLYEMFIDLLKGKATKKEKIK